MDFKVGIDNYSSLPIDFFSSCFLGDTSNLKLYAAADINAFNTSGWTGLMYACCGGHLNTVKHLLRNGATTSLRKLKDQKTSLMIAASNGDLELVKILFTPTELELTDINGWTALFHAVFFGRELCVTFLVNKGASTTKRDKLGRTPILLAMKSGMESIAKIFAKNDADQRNESVFKSRANDINYLKILSKTSSSQMQSPFKQQKSTNIYSPNGMRNIGKENVEGRRNVSPQPCAISSRVGLLTPTNQLSPLTFGQSPAYYHEKPSLNFSNKKKEDEVLVFLRDLKLEKYWPIFRDEEVDFETLLTFDDQNLREVGIKLYGPRKKILAALTNIKHNVGSRLF